MLIASEGGGMKGPSVGSPHFLSQQVAVPSWVLVAQLLEFYELPYVLPIDCVFA